MGEKMSSENQGNASERPYELVIKMANDYYSAYLTILVHDSSVKLSKDEILETLKQKNITFGIDLDAVDYAAQNPSRVENLLIAKGIPHKNGTDGIINFKVKKENKIKPKILPNGNVDFKDLSIIQTTKKGQVLAEMIPPTKGEAGTTVTGKGINAKQGKAVVFKFGKNVSVSEDGLNLIAEAEGTVIFDGDRVSIIEVLEIKGDVGVKTGNIRFSGKVKVSGNLTTGYTIDCDDDLEIMGIVESATIDCKGNVTIGAGIQGNDNAHITVNGDLVSNFINNCSCIVSGNIETGAIMHSTVVCDGSIHLKGKRGILVGGEVNVRKEIEAKTIGSEMGTITKLRLGIDSQLIDEYQKVADDLKEAKENKKKVEQLSNLLSRQIASDPGNQSLKDMLDKTNLSKNQYDADFKELSTKFMELNNFINELQDARVVANVIYVGTKLRIGNTHYNVKNTLKNVELKKEAGQIVALTI